MNDLRWTMTRGQRSGRLDQTLHQLMELDASPEAAPSKRQIRRWIDEGRVYVDRRRCRVASRTVRGGQRIELVVHDIESSGNPASKASFELDPSAILFEDEHLLAVNKPPGIATQGTRSNDLDHLLAAAQRLLSRRDSALRPEGLWLHHRLDRGTSGLILLAKSRAANRGLSRAFAEREVDKRYLVLVHGQAPEDNWTADQPLVKVRGEGGKAMSQLALPDDEGARTATTEFVCLERFRLPSCEEASFLEGRPKSGRMHQIRVHLAVDGMPVLGDRLYGDREAWKIGGQAVSRPLLHAAGLRLDHPVRGPRIDLNLPLPTDMEELLSHLRNPVADGKTPEPGWQD